MRLPQSRWLLLFVGWSLFGSLQALASALSASSGEAFALFALYLLLAWAWAGLTPAVGIWTRAIRRQFPSLGARVAAHLPFLLATALLHTWLRRALGAAMGGALAVPFEVTLLYFADLTIASYLAAVWAALVFEASATLATKERQTIELRRQLVTAQFEYLELQLRPHFLFNALGTIAELAHEAPKTAARMLRNIIALLESAIARDGRGLVPLGDELDALQPYLDIQRLRFSDWLQIDEDIGADARRALVPRFILQPLVENAVHHGLISRSAPGQIAIRARIEDDRLLIAVVDNGVGLNVAVGYRESRGLGLTNLRARLAAVYGAEATIALRDDGASAGTAASLALPLRTAAPVEAPASHAPSLDEESPSPPRIPRLATNGPSERSAVVRWALAQPAFAAISAWTAIAVLRVQHSYDYMILRHRYTADAMIGAIRYDVAVAAVWLVMTPLVFALARRVPIRRDKVVARVLAHVTCAVSLAYWHAAFTRFIAEGFQSPLWASIPSEIYAWNIAVYAIMLAIAHFRSVESWIRDRDAVAERLTRELREARFRRVMLELRPRVLLDTLRHLVELVAVNAKRAERILADLGDFLRATLNGIHEPILTLRAEGETLRAYARVLSVASARGLIVQLSIPLALMDERVPSGVLRVALDSVLFEHSKDDTVVHLEVTSGERGISIQATAQSAGGTPNSWRTTVNGSELVHEAAVA